MLAKQTDTTLAVIGKNREPQEKAETVFAGKIS